MNTAVTKTQQSALIEQVLISGDLSKLDPPQRVQYYNQVCDSLGLNPLTTPFSYITLNNKLTLYALRGCTDQLRTIHNISVDEMIESERDGVCIVTVKVRNAAGRTDMAKGAVHIANLKGEALANAIMKAETKAKRRATLSICGLGLLDETEVETIPNARPEPQRAALTPPAAPATKLSPEDEARLDRAAARQAVGETVDHDPETGEVVEEDAPAIVWAKKAIVTVKGFQDLKDYDAWRTKKVSDAIVRLGTIDADLQKQLTEAISDLLDRLNPIGA